MNVCDNAVELFSLYRFPNLMYVAVHFREYFHQCQIEQNIRGGKISCLLNDDLQTLASILLLHSPKLRGVHLLSDAAEMKMFEFFFQFCRNFPHLHYIYLTGRSCRALVSILSYFQAFITRHLEYNFPCTLNCSRELKIFYFTSIFFHLISSRTYVDQIWAMKSCIVPYSHFGLSTSKI